MDSQHDNPYDHLTRIFHEPKRLAIVSALCNAADGRSFNDLKEACETTDGNLSRHLKTLEDDGVVVIRKHFVKGRPRTTVYLSDEGRERFLEYLQALEEVLTEAAAAMAGSGSESPNPMFGGIVQA